MNLLWLIVDHCVSVRACSAGTACTKTETSGGLAVAVIATGRCCQRILCHISDALKIGTTSNAAAKGRVVQSNLAIAEKESSEISGIAMEAAGETAGVLCLVIWHLKLRIDRYCA